MYNDQTNDLALKRNFSESLVYEFGTFFGAIFAKHYNFQIAGLNNIFQYSKSFNGFRIQMICSLISSNVY